MVRDSPDPGEGAPDSREEGRGRPQGQCQQKPSSVMPGRMDSLEEFRGKQAGLLPIAVLLGNASGSLKGSRSPPSFPSTHSYVGSLSTRTHGATPLTHTSRFIEHLLYAREKIRPRISPNESEAGGTRK